VAAAAAASGKTQKASAADDDDMDPTVCFIVLFLYWFTEFCSLLILMCFLLQQYYENRLKTLYSLKTIGVNPYPHKFPVGISVAEYIEKYKSLSDGEKLDVTECLAGNTLCFPRVVFLTWRFV